MRSVFYVAVAVAVLARNSVVAAFTNADQSRFLSKPTPDFVADVMISSDSQRRFLRVTDPEDEDWIATDEERVKYGSLSKIIEKLEKNDMSHVAEILKNMEVIHVKNALEAAKKNGQITKADRDAAKTLLGLSS
ncbi:Secreted RxLR effector peptide protein [Phytophthora palmivora]|uniref:RxLR effector protein n=1 Tax=Phytophthora palmivora TaxID=4796 RepID=A0A2P4XEG9_9STRA|nr:Secreted RxLR effector peptide protein [Phytophthora palmivora]